MVAIRKYLHTTQKYINFSKLQYNYIEKFDIVIRFIFVFCCMMIMGNIIIIVQEKIVYYLSIYECKKQELDKNKIFPNYALKIINNQ